MNAGCGEKRKPFMTHLDLVIGVRWLDSTGAGGLRHKSRNTFY